MREGHDLDNLLTRQSMSSHLIAHDFIDIDCHDAASEKAVVKVGLTKTTTAEQAAGLGGGRWRRGVLSSFRLSPFCLIWAVQRGNQRAHLDLRRSGRPRLAHRVCAMHGGQLLTIPRKCDVYATTSWVLLIVDVC